MAIIVPILVLIVQWEREVFGAMETVFGTQNIPFAKRKVTKIHFVLNAITTLKTDPTRQIIYMHSTFFRVNVRQDNLQGML